MALGFASSLQLLPFPSISHLNLLPFLKRLFSFVFLKDLSLSVYFLYCGLTPCTIDLDDHQTSIHFYVPTRRRFRKPALVLVHGFGGNARWQWQHQVQALSSAFDLFVPDLIYFGGSSSTSAERSVEFQARCVGEGLRRLGVERYSACGISYGGFVVYQMAEAYTEEIETVVIMSSGICATEEQREEMLRREGRDVVEILMPERAEDLRVLVERSMYRPPSWMPGFLLQDFIHVMYMDHRKERIEMLKELLEKKVEANPLHVLNQETLIIWGDQDNVFPLYMGYQLKRSNSSCVRSLRWAPKCPCGHGYMVLKTSHTPTNPGRNFWKCPDWKGENGYGMFIWKDETSMGYGGRKFCCKPIFHILRRIS